MATFGGCAQDVVDIIRTDVRDVAWDCVILQVSVIVRGVVVDENIFRGMFGGVHLLPGHDRMAEPDCC